MSELQRFGVSLQSDLLRMFDDEIAKKGYQNRSEALRDLIRDYLIKRDIDKDAEVVGTLTLIYDHHVPELSDKLNDFQHKHYKIILSNLHIHLDHHNCLEVILLRGKCSEIVNLSNIIKGTRGVKHGKLTFTSTGENLPGV